MHPAALHQQFPENYFGNRSGGDCLGVGIWWSNITNK